MNRALRWGLVSFAAIILCPPLSGQSLDSGDLFIANHARIVHYDASSGSIEETIEMGDLSAANGGAEPLLSGEILYDDHQAYLYFSGTGGQQRLYRASLGRAVLSLASEPLLENRRGLDRNASVELTGKAPTFKGALLYLDRSEGGGVMALELRSGVHSVYGTGPDFLAFSSAEGAGMTSLDFVSLDFDPEAGDYLLLASGKSLDANGNSRPALYRIGADGQPTVEFPLGDIGSSWDQVQAAPDGGAYVLQSSQRGPSLLLVTESTRAELLDAAALGAIFGDGIELAPALVTDPTGRLYLLAQNGAVARLDPTAGDVLATATPIIAAQDYLDRAGVAMTDAVGLAYVPKAPVTYQVTESSLPEGLVAERSYPVIENRFVTTSNPPITSGNRRLGFWSANGQRVGANGTLGRGLLRPTVQVTEDLEIVAQYFETGIDSDGDRLEDWWELWMFGDLARGPQDNDDEDAFTHEEEQANGYDATVRDIARPGGIAARASASIGFLQANGFRYRLLSAPYGLIAEENKILAIGSSITTPYREGATSGHTFVGWEVNGQRVTSPDGVYRRQLTLEPSSDVEVVGRYVLTEQDSDSDGLPDWYEWQNFGSLAQHSGSDPDEDGLNIADELASGFSPVLPDRLRSGGIAARASTPLTFSVGRSLYSVESVPFGVINSSAEYVEDGAERITPYIGTDLRAGMAFGYWTINGERVADSSGAARRQVTTTIDETTQVLAHFFRPNEDTDEDGIEDVIEWRFQGDLSLDRNDDLDGDGLLIGEEIDSGFALGLEERIRSGGIAGRSSVSITFNASDRKRYDFRTAPFGLAPTTTDYIDTGATVSSPTYLFESLYTGFRFTHFTRNGTRVGTSEGQSRRVSVFDIQEDTELVAHFAADDRDSDGDGIRDYIELRLADNLGDLGPQSDPDGDGLTMFDEILWGTNGVTADRFLSGGIAARASTIRPIVLDVAPSGIALTTSRIIVGSPVGSEVGQLFAIGGNPNDRFTFQFVLGSGSGDNSRFLIFGDRIFLNEPLSAVEELSIRVRAIDGEGRSQEQSLTIQVVAETSNLYEEFLAVFFTPEQLANPLFSGPASDPDGDGVANLLEYAHGLDPSVPNGSPFQIHQVTVPAGPGPAVVEFAFPWRVSDTEINFQLERVSNLTDDWLDLPHSVVSEDGNDGIAQLIIRAELDQTVSNAQFFRLRAE